MSNPRGPAVDDRDLRVFLVVAEELHFARSAERLGLSGSRVSQIVGRLERRIGCTLVERNSRQVELTVAGRRLRELVDPLLSALDSAVQEVGDMSSRVQGVCRLGIYTTAYQETLDEVLAHFESVHPDASVSVRETGLSEDVIAPLRRDVVDVLWMRLPVDQDDIVVGPVMSCEARVALLARDHPLAEHRTLSYEQLADYSVTDNPLFPAVTMEQFVPSRTASGREVARKRVLSSSDVLRAVATGAMIHPTVPAFVDSMQHPNVVSRPITDLPHTRTALVWLRRRDGDRLIHCLAAAAAHVVTACADSPG